MSESKRRKLAFPELYGTDKCPGARVRGPRSVSLARWQQINGTFTRTSAVYNQEGKLVAEPGQRVNIKADGKIQIAYRLPLGWRSPNRGVERGAD